MQALTCYHLKCKRLLAKSQEIRVLQDHESHPDGRGAALYDGSSIGLQQAAPGNGRLWFLTRRFQVW
jgi:hypothetical protein